MTDIPHFSLPFAWVTSGAGGVTARVNEQESVAEIAACCEAIIRTVQGERTSLPEFGRPELEFNTSSDLTRAALSQALILFEPRVQALITAGVDPDDVEMQIVRAILSPTDREEGDVA